MSNIHLTSLNGNHVLQPTQLSSGKNDGVKGASRGLTPSQMEVEGLVSLEGEDDGADGVGVGLDWGGEEGGGPSRLRLDNEVKCCLPSDMTRRRPVDGEGDSRRWRGRRGGGVAVASPDAGEDVVAVASRREAWWSAARF